MYTENKRKESLNIEDLNSTNQSISYISTVNARKNPDILAPGGMFIKGNKYFSKKLSIESKKAEEDEQQEESQKSNAEKESE